MKKLFIVFPILSFLVFSCSKEDFQSNDELAGNASLKCAGSVVRVFPNGTDDTQNLIDAFALAKTRGRNAVVKLMDGTFYLGMIEVKEFTGTLTGCGKEKTIITNLPDLIPDGVIALNKLPALITFIGGDMMVSDLSVKMPEALSWLGTQEMNMLLFSDCAADFMPVKKHIGVNIQNVAVEGILQKDVTVYDGTIHDMPFNSFNGIKFAPDWRLPIGNTLIPRANIDVTVSNCSFSNFSRGAYAYGCQSGNFRFGTGGGNVFTDNSQGLVVNENIGINVKIRNNEFNIPDYFWDGIDINALESFQFEYVHSGNMGFDIQHNHFNIGYANGMGVWDNWRYDHPDNPCWMQMLWKDNTFRALTDGAWIGVAFALKGAVFSDNNNVGDYSGGYMGNFGTYWIPPEDPNFALSVSENCKFLNNHFLMKDLLFFMEWDTQNYLVMGDLTNVTIEDHGINNKVIGKTNPGHGHLKSATNPMDRMERIHDMYSRQHDRNRH
jgi:hypothetical protein